MRCLESSGDLMFNIGSRSTEKCIHVRTIVCLQNQCIQIVRELQSLCLTLACARVRLIVLYKI